MIRFKFYAKLLVGIVFCAVLVTCGGGGGSGGNNSTAWDSLPSGNNQVSIFAGVPRAGGVNLLLTKVTLCPAKDQSHCQTIDNVLVDSGSSGLRINQSALRAINFSPINVGSNSVFNCIYFGSGFASGKMYYSDLYMGGEHAENVPLQIMGGSIDSQVVNICSQNGTIPNVVSLLNLIGVNGIIGVNANANAVVSAPYVYSNAFACDGSGNNCTSISSSRMNTNPVSLFDKDNNGIIFALPSVSAPQSNNISGFLTFGINTAGNNILDSANNPTILYGNPENLWGGFFSDDNVASMFDSGSGFSGIYYLNNGAGSSILPVISPSDIKSYQATNYLCPANLTTTYSIPFYSYNSTASASYSFLAQCPLGITTAIIPNAFQIYTTQYPNTTVGNIFGLDEFFGKKIYVDFTTDSSPHAPLTQSPAWAYENN